MVTVEKLNGYTVSIPTFFFTPNEFCHRLVDAQLLISNGLTSPEVGGGLWLANLVPRLCQR